MTTKPTLDEVYIAIRTAQQQLLTSFCQRNATNVAACYAAEGQILPPYSAAISGRTAIRAFWQGCIDMGIGTVQRTPLEMDCLADTVNEVGEYRFLDRHGRVLDVGKYVIIWKAQQGEWQIQRDIWTSSLPAA